MLGDDAVLNRWGVHGGSGGGHGLTVDGLNHCRPSHLFYQLIRFDCLEHDVIILAIKLHHVCHLDDGLAMAHFKVVPVLENVLTCLESSSTTQELGLGPCQIDLR